MFGSWLVVLSGVAAQVDDIGRLPMEVIVTEGQLAISDGISLFTFRKDGRFTGIPLREGGRTILGHWKAKGGQRAFVIEGEWKWAEKQNVRQDFRTMTITIISLSDRKLRYKNGEAYESEFRISEIHPLTKGRR